MEQTSMRVFETESLPLAAAFLTTIPDTTFAGFSQSNTMSDRLLFQLQYKPTADQAVMNLLQQFHARTLHVLLYKYNITLNGLRDRLKDVNILPHTTDTRIDSPRRNRVKTVPR